MAVKCYNNQVARVGLITSLERVQRLSLCHTYLVSDYKSE